MLNSFVLILGNYLLVQTCIILFMLPFLVFYWRKHPDITRSTLSQQLQGFFLSKQSNYLVFFWAMGEALVWFVIPEFFLLLIIFMRVHRKKELLAYDVAGTAIGTTIAYFIPATSHAVAQLPYIQDKMVQQTIDWYHQIGVLGLIYQPFSGVPYKVFTLTAHNFHFFFPYFLAVAILVRMSRYVLVFGIFTAMYPGLQKYVKTNYVWLFFIATFIFSCLLLRVYHSYSY